MNSSRFQEISIESSSVTQSMNQQQNNQLQQSNYPFQTKLQEEFDTTPEIFNNQEELYILLLDMFYTKQYSCLDQHQQIINFILENNLVCNPIQTIQQFNKDLNETEFINFTLSAFLSMIVTEQYQLAQSLVEVTLNDLTTKIQNFQCEGFWIQLSNLKFSKITKLIENIVKSGKQINLVKLFTLLTILCYEFTGQFNKIKGILNKNEDLSFKICFIRQQFNQLSQMINTQQLQQLLKQINQIQKKVEESEFQENFLNYSKTYVNRILQVYETRILTLIGEYQRANQSFLQLQMKCEDGEMRDDVVQLYLDNFMRQVMNYKRQEQWLIKYQYQNCLLSDGVISCLLFGQKNEFLQKLERNSIEFSEQEKNPQIQTCGFYYNALCQIINRNFMEAKKNFELALQHNQQKYKYPSELIGISFVPQMIQFDMATLLVLINQIPQDLKIDHEMNKMMYELSPERFQIAYCLDLIILLKQSLESQYPGDYFPDVVQKFVKYDIIEDMGIIGSKIETFHIQETPLNILLLAESYQLGIEYFSQVQSEFSETYIKVLKMKLEEINNQVPELYINDLQSEVETESETSMKHISITDDIFEKQNYLQFCKQNRERNQNCKEYFNYLTGNIINEQKLPQELPEKYAQTQIYKAYIYYQNDRIQNAIQTLQNIDNPKAIHLLSKLYFLNKNQFKASQILQVLINNRSNKQYTYDQALILNSQGDIQNPLKLLESDQSEFSRYLQLIFLLNHFNQSETQISGEQMVQLTQNLLQHPTQSEIAFIQSQTDYSQIILTQYKNYIDEILNTEICKIIQVNQMVLNDRTEFKGNKIRFVDLCENKYTFALGVLIIAITSALINYQTDKIDIQLVIRILQLLEQNNIKIKNSIVNNLIIYIIQVNKLDLLQTIFKLSDEKIESEFLQQVSGSQIILSKNKKLKEITVQLQNKKYLMNIVDIEKSAFIKQPQILSKNIFDQILIDNLIEQNEPKKQVKQVKYTPISILLSLPPQKQGYDLNKVTRISQEEKTESSVSSQRESRQRSTRPIIRKF